MAMVGSEEGTCTITSINGASRHVTQCSLTEGTCTAAANFASIDFCDDSGPKSFILQECSFNEKTKKYKQIDNVKSETNEGSATRYVLKDGTVILFNATNVVDPGEQAECIPHRK
jgi:hypothetical protein